MKILYLHGWNSTCGGVKPSYLAAQGHEIIEPELPDDDFDAALRIAQAEFLRIRPELVTGSSRGGSLAMNLDSADVPLVLLCPAWKRWGQVACVKPATQILHSRADEVIPFADTLELLRNSGLDESVLTVTGDNHRLADAASLAAMAAAVARSGR
ncbi:MAG: hypothetical protein ACKN9T_17730 [Candidatus Methylumidiphilus sp.]